MGILAFIGDGADDCGIPLEYAVEELPRRTPHGPRPQPCETDAGDCANHQADREREPEAKDGGLLDDRREAHDNAEQQACDLPRPPPETFFQLGKRFTVHQEDMPNQFAVNMGTPNFNSKLTPVSPNDLASHAARFFRRDTGTNLGWKPSVNGIASSPSENSSAKA